MHGVTPEDTLLHEIMVLGQLKWEQRCFASVRPITLLFARHVGAILAELPPGGGAARVPFYL
jgi:hypothetical protein